MANRWFIADLHFSHRSVVEVFKYSDGTPLRQFDSIEEHDETIIDNWNKTVRDHDLVYMLGDLSMSRKAIKVASRLKGRKRLIGGNHDFGSIADYQEAGFEKLYGVKVFNGDFICSHVPLKEECLDRFVNNCHGHLHANHINNPKYLCVSVEQTGLFPIPHEEVKRRISLNKTAFDETGNVIDWCKLARGIKE